jgi:hypothetical protein
MWFNLVLNNHGAIEEAERLTPLIHYIRQSLSICGHETTVVHDQLYETAINLYFEHFIDPEILHDISLFKQATKAKIGVIATELMIGGTIPYARHGMYVVYEDPARRIAERLAGFDTALTHADFLWSFLERTAADYAAKAPLSLFYPVGSTGISTLMPVRTPKDLDVFFFGTWTPHRAAILDRFAAIGIQVIAAGPGFPLGHLPQPLLDSYIGRAKIALNLTLADRREMPDDLDPRFASCMRIKAMLDQGVCIVSEDIPLDNPYADMMISAPPDQLPHICAQLLASGDWQEIGVRQMHLFHQRMNVAKICAPIIDQTLSHLGGT